MNADQVRNGFYTPYRAFQNQCISRISRWTWVSSYDIILQSMWLWYAGGGWISVCSILSIFKRTSLSQCRTPRSGQVNLAKALVMKVMFCIVSCQHCMCCLLPLVDSLLLILADGFSIMHWLESLKGALNLCAVASSFFRALGSEAWRWIEVQFTSAPCLSILSLCWIIDSNFSFKVISIYRS